MVAPTPTASPPRRSLLPRLIFLCLLLPLTLTDAWEWSDFVRGTGSPFLSNGFTATNSATTPTLSIDQVAELRVRDIKRRLTRNHGYSAEELSRILDKKELVQALAFEEEKLRLLSEAHAKRTLIQQGIIAAVISVFLILCWPLFQHAYEVAMVNLVVYIDRKKHEANRCRDLASIRGMLGIVCMGILDVLQIWLTISVILSWVTSSKFFFPVPKLTVRPAQFMGDQMAQSPFANYGINLGSMLVTYGMRFLYGRIEHWTGQVLASAHRQQRKQERQVERESETPSDTAARRAARKAARWQKQMEQQQTAAAAASNSMSFRSTRPPPPPPPEWEQHLGGMSGQNGSIPVARSKAHCHFLEQLDEQTSETNDQDASNDAGELTTALDELD